MGSEMCIRDSPSTAAGAEDKDQPEGKKSAPDYGDEFELKTSKAVR